MQFRTPVMPAWWVLNRENYQIQTKLRYFFIIKTSTATMFSMVNKDITIFTNEKYLNLTFYNNVKYILTFTNFVFNCLWVLTVQCLRQELENISISRWQVFDNGNGDWRILGMAIFCRAGQFCVTPCILCLSSTCHGYYLNMNSVAYITMSIGFVKFSTKPLDMVIILTTFWRQTPIAVARQLMTSRRLIVDRAGLGGFPIQSEFMTNASC